MKTRLVEAIGDSLATALYRSLTNAVIGATRPGHGGDFRRVLCFAPNDAGAEISQWFPGEALEPQEGSDLGARMHRAFVNSFGRGSEATVLIGTDCLTLKGDVVAAAYQALETADVVLRSAEDGGYTLIGLREPQPALFSLIEWSTDTVLAVTLAHASKAGLSVSVHGLDADIDTVDDLRRHFATVRAFLDESVARRIEGLL